MASIAVAAADRPVSPSEFERFVEGKTLNYSTDAGQIYGVEQYLDRRRVRWSYLDGECQYGTWYPAGDQVCFVYEDIPDPQCWKFYMRGERLLAKFHSDSSEYYQTGEADEELICPGPAIGV